MATAGVRFAVRLTPRAGRDRIDGVSGGELRVHVSAPPVDGAATRALLRLLASDLDLPTGAVSLVTGASSRHKVVEVAGVDAASLRTRWPGLAV